MEQILRTAYLPWWQRVACVAAELCPVKDRKDVAAQAESKWVIVSQSPPHWANNALRFSVAARALNPKQHEEIVRRDAYRCANPGCHFQL